MSGMKRLLSFLFFCRMKSIVVLSAGRSVVLPLLDKSEAAREIEEKELDVRQANGLRVRAERLFTEVSFCLFDLCTGMEVTADKRATPKNLKELVAHTLEERRGASKCGDGLVVMITEVCS